MTIYFVIRHADTLAWDASLDKDFNCIKPRRIPQHIDLAIYKKTVKYFFIQQLYGYIILNTPPIYCFTK
jgi:hypothetical protein